MFSVTKKQTYQPVTISEEYYFFSIQVKRSLASRLKCWFYNCPLNYDSLFPDGALPSTCTQSLLVQSYSTSCWSHYPHPYFRLQKGNPNEEIFPPSLQQFFGDVICGLNLSLPRKRGNHYSRVLYIQSGSAAAGYCTSPCGRQSEATMLSLPD